MLHKKPSINNGLWYAFGNEWTDYVKSVGGGYDSQYKLVLQSKCKKL